MTIHISILAGLAALGLTACAAETDDPTPKPQAPAEAGDVSYTTASLRLESDP